MLTLLRLSFIRDVCPLTIGLLWGCFATLFLCTWSAIHPDLAAETESEWDFLLRRIGFVIVCLVAPELFACYALATLREAYKLRAEVSFFFGKV